MLERTTRLLFNEAGDGAGGGSSILTSPGSGSGPAAASGGKGAEDKAGQGQASGASPSGNGASGQAPTDWKSALPKELQEEPSLKVIHDLTGLAKSYVNAQKLVGADKIPVPSKHATEDDWKNVFHKLGLPQDSKEYVVKFKEGVSIDEEFSNQFKEVAFKSGVLPKQAQALADWWSDASLKAEQTLVEKHKAKDAQELETLKSTWGEAFDVKVNYARQALVELNDPEFTKFLDQTGLGNNAKVIKALAGLGEKFLKESSEKGGKGTQEPAFTPAEAQKEYSKILGDVTHPYFIKDHPNHKAAVEEVSRLFKAAHTKA